MGTKKTDGLLPPVTENDTIFLAIICIIPRGESSALALARWGGVLLRLFRSGCLNYDIDDPPETE